MGQDDCLTFGPPNLRVIRLSWIVGCILSAIGYGALLVVGCACYVGLRRRDLQSGGHSRVNKNKALIIYVIFTLVLTTVTEIVEIILTLRGVLNDVCFSQNLVPQSPYVGPFTIPLWLINATTDGLFVWRCYTVCRGLQGQRGWITLLWAMPLVVYIVMICTGVIVVTRFAAFHVRGTLSDALPPFQYSVTGFLNALITTSIIILILRYRRAARKAFGENHEMPYLSIMTVLIESASLVVVIDILAAVGYSQGVLGNIATQVWVPMQPMASFLIIYRVSQGSDYFHRKSEGISTLRFAPASEHHVEYPV